VPAKCMAGRRSDDSRIEATTKGNGDGHTQAQPSSTASASLETGVASASPQELPKSLIRLLARTRPWRMSAFPPVMRAKRTFSASFWRSDGLRSALRAAPDYADAMFNLALLLQRNNKHAEAAEYWRRYLANDAPSEWAARARRSLNFCEMQCTRPRPDLICTR
jgi:hypothetical protein